MIFQVWGCLDPCPLSGSARAMEVTRQNLVSWTCHYWREGSIGPASVNSVESSDSTELTEAFPIMSEPKKKEKMSFEYQHKRMPFPIAEKSDKQKSDQHVHLVAISEFPKRQTLFQLQKNLSTFKSCIN